MDKVACYSFLSWSRKGIANEISQTDVLGGVSGNSGRATVRVKVKVDRVGASDGAASTADIEKDVQCFGPGDIVGVAPQAIIRTEPKQGVTNFEPNYLPYIEFYEEGFLWQYTPASPNGKRLRPWLALLVLEPELEFDQNDFNPLASPLPSITVPNGPLDTELFPKENQYWAWGHVHLNQLIDDVAGSDLSERLQNLIASNPNLGCSRLICPRKLAPNSRYQAFLVPAYEKGRLAGLGAEKSVIDAADTQQYSWGFAHTDFEGQWPYYFTWEFRTGSEGDFEELVRKLLPRILDNRVGRRLMDISNPGYALHYNGGANESEGAVYLEGALRVPGNDASNLALSTASAARDFVGDLENLLNLEDQLRKDDIPADSPFKNNPFYQLPNGTAASTIEDDPIITPPIYGKWHILEKRVRKNQAGRWLNHLNLDPKNRTTAGFGANVIKKHQESYMDRAWDQFGEILEANRKLLMAQLAEQLSKNLYAKHLDGLSSDRLVYLTSQLHGRLRMQESTILNAFAESTLPNVVLSNEFTKMTRFGGPVAKFGATAVQAEILNKTVNNEITPAPRYDTFGTHGDVNVSQLKGFISDLTTDGPPSVSPSRLSPASPRFRFRVRDTRVFDTVSFADVPKEELEEGFQAYTGYFESSNWTLTEEKSISSLDEIANTIQQKISPAVTIKSRVLSRLKIQDFTKFAPPEEIVPIMAAPEFDDPMYEPLRDISSELLVPNLDLIPNNTISILESNQEFIESYMVGLNFEFGRELLWREFLTDQRGSYFRQFWDAVDNRNTNATISLTDFEASTKDIKPIHTWPKNSGLGKHRPDSHSFFDTKKVSSVTGEEENKMVLVIRGDLLKKYPNTIIYLQEAKWKGTATNPQKNKPRDLGPESSILYPIFKAKIEPDIYFLGFNITASEAKGDTTVNDKPGYFCILKERTGELHFGMDVRSTGATSSWNDLSWEDLPANITHIDLGDQPGQPDRDGIVWDQTQSSAADMAFILYQNPYMVAIHAKEMIPADV